MCVRNMKTIQQTLSEISSGNWTYHPLQLKFIIASKSKVKKWVKDHNPKKAHLQPIRDVGMQYESNPANGFRDIARKRNTDAQPHMVMTMSPAPTSLAGDKNEVEMIAKNIIYSLSHHRVKITYQVGETA